MTVVTNYAIEKHALVDSWYHKTNYYAKRNLQVLFTQ